MLSTTRCLHSITNTQTLITELERTLRVRHGSSLATIAAAAWSNVSISLLCWTLKIAGYADSTGPFTHASQHLAGFTADESHSIPVETTLGL